VSFLFVKITRFHCGLFCAGYTEHRTSTLQRIMRVVIYGGFREHSVRFREHSVRFREHSVRFREHSVRFREHSVRFREQ
jgi:hypothetical protein